MNEKTSWQRQLKLNIRLIIPGQNSNEMFLMLKEVSNLHHFESCRNMLVRLLMDEQDKLYKYHHQMIVRMQVSACMSQDVLKYTNIMGNGFVRRFYNKRILQSHELPEVKPFVSNVISKLILSLDTSVHIIPRFCFHVCEWQHRKKLLRHFLEITDACSYRNVVSSDVLPVLREQIKKEIKLSTFNILERVYAKVLTRYFILFYFIYEASKSKLSCISCYFTVTCSKFIPG